LNVTPPALFKRWGSFLITFLAATAVDFLPICPWDGGLKFPDQLLSIIMQPSLFWCGLPCKHSLSESLRCKSRQLRQLRLMVRCVYFIPLICEKTEPL
jgi:hypothetical protein